MAIRSCAIGSTRRSPSCLIRPPHASGGGAPGCRLQPLMQIIGASLTTFLASPAAEAEPPTYLYLTGINAGLGSRAHSWPANLKGSPWPGNKSAKRPEDCAGVKSSRLRGVRQDILLGPSAATSLMACQGGGLNIAHEAIDRHVLAGQGDKLALRWIGRDGRVQDFTYADASALP